VFRLRVAILRFAWDLPDIEAGLCGDGFADIFGSVIE
jgi:hypothetical protein